LPNFGDLHDRQALIDEFRSGVGRSVELASDYIDAVVQVTEVEIDDLYGLFLKRRSRVLASCTRAQHQVQRSVLPMGTLAVAGAVAVTAGLEAGRRRRAARRDAGSGGPVHEVSVRIPVAVRKIGARSRTDVT